MALDQGLENLWKAPIRLDELPESGAHRVLEADAPTRAAIARVAGLVELPRLSARLEAQRRGAAGLHVIGTVSATVVQSCVVTLEPVTNEIAEAVDLMFEPASAAPARSEAEIEVDPEEAGDPPEPLVDGTVDLGALAIEFLLLGLDPYPRKPDAVFSVPHADESVTSPFAALAALKPKPKPSGDA
jgi:uncharacterized metal-binding protein YceD (DUF177 family)